VLQQFISKQKVPTLRGAIALFQVRGFLNSLYLLPPVALKQTRHRLPVLMIQKQWNRTGWKPLYFLPDSPQMFWRRQKTAKKKTSPNPPHSDEDSTGFDRWMPSQGEIAQLLLTRGGGRRNLFSIASSLFSLDWQLNCICSRLFHYEIITISIPFPQKCSCCFTCVNPMALQSVRGAVCLVKSNTFALGKCTILKRSLSI